MLFFLLLFHSVNSQFPEYFVSPKGNDIQGCGLSQNFPCQSVNYTVHNTPANGTDYTLVFDEGIYTGKSNLELVAFRSEFAFRSLYGPAVTAFQCDQERFYVLDIFYCNVSLTGISFQNCIGTTKSYREAALRSRESKLSIDNCAFINNTGPNDSMFGTSIYFTGGDVAINNSLFRDNVGFFGSAIAGYGLTTPINSPSINSINVGTIRGSIKIRNCQFINNTGYSNGYGGAIGFDSILQAAIHDSFFWNNSAGFGGAIYQVETGLIVTNSTFNNNSAMYNGGAIFTSSTPQQTLLMEPSCTGVGPFMDIYNSYVEAGRPTVTQLYDEAHQYEVPIHSDSISSTSFPSSPLSLSPRRPSHCPRSAHQEHKPVPPHPFKYFNYFPVLDKHTMTYQRSRPPHVRSVNDLCDDEIHFCGASLDRHPLEANTSTSQQMFNTMSILLDWNNNTSDNELSESETSAIFPSGPFPFGWDDTNIFYKGWSGKDLYNDVINYIDVIPSASAYIDCLFQYNVAWDRGGAVAYEKGHTAFWDSHFLLNQAHERGGAIFSRLASQPFIATSTFDRNHAWKGGAVNTEDTSCLSLVNSTFTNSYSDYGGILFADYTSQVWFRDSVLSGGNTDMTNISGAAVFLSETSAVTISSSYVVNHLSDKGTMYVQTTGTLSIENSSVHDNQAQEGGAIYMGTSLGELIIRQTHFKNNTAFTGAVIYSFGGRIIIYRSNFTKNHALATTDCRGIDGYGGVFFFQQEDGLPPANCSIFETIAPIFLKDNSAMTAGGVAYWNQDAPDCATNDGEWCVDCTMVDNQAPYGNNTSSFLQYIDVASDGFETKTNEPYEYIMFYVPGKYFEDIQIIVRDAFNNTLQGKHLSVRVNITLSDPDFLVLTGDNTHDAVNGTMVFSELAITLKMENIPNVLVDLLIQSEPPTEIIRVRLIYQPCDQGDAILPVGEDGTYVCADTEQLYDYEQAIFFVFISIEVAFIFFSGAVLIWHRQSKIVVSGSFLFQLIILIGALLICVAGLVAIQEATVLLCSVKVWCVDLGFMMVFGSLFIKTFRLHKIFNHVKIEVVGLKDVHLLFRLFLLLLYDMIVLALWNALLGVKVPNQYQAQCDWGGTAVLPYALAGALSKIALLSVGIYYTYQVRSIPSLYNESKFIALAVYNIILLAVVFFFCHALLGTNARARESTVLECSLYVYGVTSTLALLFLPKIVMIFGPAETETMNISGDLGIHAAEDSESHHMRQLEQTLVQVKQETLGSQKKKNAPWQSPNSYAHPKRTKTNSNKSSRGTWSTGSYRHGQSESEGRVLEEKYETYDPPSISILSSFSPGRSTKKHKKLQTPPSVLSNGSIGSPPSTAFPFLPVTSTSIQQEHDDIKEQLADKLQEVDVLMREKRWKLKNLDRLRAEFARVGVDIAQLQWELDYKKNHPSLYVTASQCEPDPNS